MRLCEARNTQRFSSPPARSRGEPEQAQRFLTDPEYEQNRAYRDFHLDWLRAHLGPEALGHLEDFCGLQALAGEAKQHALLRAALAAGVRLGSLGQLAE